MVENKDYVYLGDGVYASFDGYQIWLDLRGQDSITHIAIEHEVFNRLVKYGAKCGFLSDASK